VRIELVVRGILRGVANDFIESPQLFVQRELHKERFDELAGVTDLKRFEFDWFANAPGLLDRTCSGICAIRSHMNGHVRLEERCVVPPREIVDHSLKKAVRWLRRNEPVSNENLCGHARLTPLLQLDDVAFGISRVDDVKATDAIYFCCSNLSDGAAASGNHCLQRLVYIVYRKCNVRESVLVRDWHATFNEFVIAENLEGRAIFTIDRQTQMNAG